MRSASFKPQNGFDKTQLQISVISLASKRRWDEALELIKREYQSEDLSRIYGKLLKVAVEQKEIDRLKFFLECRGISKVHLQEARDEAVKLRNNEALELLLAANAGVEYHGENNMSLMHLAVLNDDAATLGVLMKNKAPTDQHAIIDGKKLTPIALLATKRNKLHNARAMAHSLTGSNDTFDSLDVFENKRTVCIFDNAFIPKMVTRSLQNLECRYTTRMKQNELAEFLQTAFSNLKAHIEKLSDDHPHKSLALQLIAKVSSPYGDAFRPISLMWVAMTDREAFPDEFLNSLGGFSPEQRELEKTKYIELRIANLMRAMGEAVKEEIYVQRDIINYLMNELSGLHPEVFVVVDEKLVKPSALNFAKVFVSASFKKGFGETKPDPERFVEAKKICRLGLRTRLSQLFGTVMLESERERCIEEAEKTLSF